MDDEKIIKQKLLKSEIIDHSYDQSEFIEYCMQKKKDGDDLNNWTYEELKNIIKEFITKINNEDIKEKKEKKEQKELIEENNKEEKNIEINDENEEKIIKIKCRELKKNILNDKKIYTTIQNSVLIKNNNILSNNSYVIYEIITSNRQKDSKDKIYYKVQRKYSDFIQLRDLLSKFFPYNYIPSLPEKSHNYLLKKGTDQKIINYLDIFLTAIVSKEEFKAFDGTFFFLTIPDNDEFKNKIKEILILFLSIHYMCLR